MNHLEDPVQVVADLRPASLDQLAEDGYARRRNGDLARMMAEPAGKERPGRRLTVVRASRGRILVAAGAGLAAAAVTAAVLSVPSGHGTNPAVATPAGQGTQATSAGAVLLTAAHVAASQPAASGTYWYVKERDFEPATPLFGAKMLKPNPKEPTFRASFAATQQTWTGATRTRTIVNEQLVFNFASASDKAKWVAAGKPKLTNQSGKLGFTGPATNNYAFGGYTYNAGPIKVSLATARNLPVTPGKLDTLVRSAWNHLSSQQRAATVGFTNPTFGEYLLQVGEALLTGPVTPGTRAAVYGLLAKEPGVTVVPQVTDPLGRVGTAVGYAGEGFMVINPATASVLDITSYTVHHSGDTIPATVAGTEAYLTMGWTNQLGS
jgi:hypothetical protein